MKKKKLRLIKRSPANVQPQQLHQPSRTDRQSLPLKKSDQGKKDKGKGVTESSVGAVADPTYEKAWQLLQGRTTTPSVISRSHATVFDGTLKGAAMLAAHPVCTQKKGLFVTRQQVSKPTWETDAIARFNTFVIEYDDGATTDEQAKRFLKHDLPFSFLVWSGNKSVHAWVILDQDVSREEFLDCQAMLCSIFPTADKSVLKTPNKLVRFPSVDGEYNQPILEYRGAVKKESFVEWLKSRALEVIDEKIKTVMPLLHAQDKLAKYWDQHERKGRLLCPICSARGKGGLTNLKITPNDEGRLLFHCFRCDLTERDRSELQEFFLPNQPTKMNRLLDAFQHEIAGQFWWNTKDGVRYRVADSSPYILQSCEDTPDGDLYKIYEAVCRDVGAEISTRNFKEIVSVSAKRNAVTLKECSRDLVTLQDGTQVNMRKNFRTRALSDFTNFALPISASDFKSETPTPVWDAFCESHATKEDIGLLHAFLGYAFSAASVSFQQSMLIIKGPSDTGKSVILDLLAEVLPDHYCKISVADCLESQDLALGILGKRLALSREATVKAKDGARFRALVSGEEVRIRRLYVGRYVCPHNTVFIAATNDDAWIEDSIENAKRIRVINWDNPVAANEMDRNLLQRLVREQNGIIVKCLLMYSPYVNERFPMNESTIAFMDQAGRNVNAVLDWCRERELKRGDNFWQAEDVYALYRMQRKDRMSFHEFSRKLAKALSDCRGKKTIKGRDVRGYYLNISKMALPK